MAGKERIPGAGGTTWDRRDGCKGSGTLLHQSEKCKRLPARDNLPIVGQGDTTDRQTDRHTPHTRIPLVPRFACLQISEPHINSSSFFSPQVPWTSRAAEACLGTSAQNG